jgi:uncharacterized protein YutE (UPF0331/DUF86 family)/predicted nucleotidyltransferase
MEVTFQNKLKKLKEYFSKNADISMVFIFGSYARDRQISESDFDIAIYFFPEGRAIEWEETKNYDGEDKIWRDVEKIVGIKTDFVILNRASSVLASSIVREGIPLIIKDRSLYLRFLLIISSAAEHFREFVHEFWAIKQRSLSISEDDKIRLIRIVDFLETEIRDFSGFNTITLQDYESNTALRRNVERWVENIVNSSIDIAKIVLASEKKRIPQTYREILWEMSLLSDFPQETAESLAKFAKLRNILAHEYLDIRFNQIRQFIDESENSYRKLVDFVKRFI